MPNDRCNFRNVLIDRRSVHGHWCGRESQCNSFIIYFTAFQYFPRFVSNCSHIGSNRFSSHFAGRPFTGKTGIFHESFHDYYHLSCQMIIIIGFHYNSCAAHDSKALICSVATAAVAAVEQQSQLSVQNSLFVFIFFLLYNLNVYSLYVFASLCSAQHTNLCTHMGHGPQSAQVILYIYTRK